MTSVRGHKRSTPSGGTTRVRHHTRRGLVSPGHSWKLLRRSVSAARRRKRFTAAILGTAAGLELAAWLTFTGVALILATFAVLAGATAWLAATGAGMPTPVTGGKRPPQRRRQGPKPAPAAPKPAGAATAPDETKTAPRAAPPDHAATLGKLGAIWSDDFDDYATGKKGAGQVHCALCQCAPCRCPPFGSEAYFKLIDFRHGRGKAAADG